ncbi:MAG TPA: nuclear transport factor 2 family protein [Candidatus Krumholzibacteria bacterium]|nr:nuclear transport factor 2 family protein [Candidatus Krumholzibacteria bacterium]
MAAIEVGCQQERHEAQTPAGDSLTVVRNELAARYTENEAGFIARDPDRVMRLRHPDFHTITPDGKASTREQMYERTRQFISHIERFDFLTETITGLALEGDTAHAIVDQRTIRQQRLGDGTLHEVRTSVVQRESWIRTPKGWLLWRVDQIQPGETLVDGKPLP